MLSNPRSNSPTSRPLWLIRAVARAPRVTATAAGAVLALVGAKALLTPAPSARTTTNTSARGDLGAQSFAEAFARAYLTWDGDAPERRDRALSQFGLAPDALGVDVPPRGRQTVSWTTVAALAHGRDGSGTATIAADTSNGPVHLAVNVGRDRRGRLFISSPPAIVGPPSVTTRPLERPDREVDDAVAEIARRVVKNYLAREREDLAADLAPGAVVSLPETPLAAGSVDRITWSAPGRRVAVVVDAERRDGLRLRLRYELAVVRRAGRWLVKTVHVNPAAREAAP